MESLGDILRRRQILRATSAASSDTSSRAEGDILAHEELDDDALLTGAAGEAACPICKGAGYFRRDVPFGDPDFGRAVPCECRIRRLRERQLDNLRELANLGPLARLTFQNLDETGRTDDVARRQRYQAICREARAFADDPKGWLVLEGPSGAGKTHLAAAITGRCVEQGRQALFIVVPDLLDHLRSTFSPSSEISYDDLFALVRDVGVLVLDEFGSQSATLWAQEKLFQIVNHRYNAARPTVFVVNPSVRVLDDRLRSRLSDPQLARVLAVDTGPLPIFKLGDVMRLPLLQKMTFETFERSKPYLSADQRQNLEIVHRRALGFAQEPEGWLVLTGTVGCGKTHLAAAIANYRRSRGEPVLFVVVPDLLDHLRATFSPESRVSYDELFEEVRSAAVLILDDLGTESSSPWAEEKLFQIINHRYNAMLPTVITTNRPIESLDRRLGSRMVDPTISTAVGIRAPDFRTGGQEAADTPQVARRADRRRTT